MARKAIVNKEMILDGAFRLVKEKGAQELTARKLAEEIGCSTQPIFRIYENMKELEDELFDKAANYYSEYYMSFAKTEKTPFVNLGLAYIAFAKNNEKLFRLLFVDEGAKGKSMYDLINGENQGFVIAEIKKAEGISPQKASQLFMLIWTFIHGMACMVLADDFDLEDAEAVEMLENAYKAFAQQ